MEKSWFEGKEAETFLNLFNDFDDEYHREVAKLLFVYGLSKEEVAEKTNYSVRHIERLKSNILKVALKRALKKIMGSDTE